MDANDREERKSFLALTEAHVNGNDLPAALNLARARLERRPGDLDARMTLCRIRLRQGRMDEARAMLEEMEESIAGLSEIYAGMGDACLEKGMREAAERYFRKCLLLGPDAPLAGDVLEKLGKIEEQSEIAAAEGGRQRRSHPLSRRSHSRNSISARAICGPPRRSWRRSCKRSRSRSGPPRGLGRSGR